MWRKYRVRATRSSLSLKTLLHKEYTQVLDFFDRKPGIYFFDSLLNEKNKEAIAEIIF